MEGIILAIISILGPVLGYLVNKLVGGLNNSDAIVAANSALAAKLDLIRLTALKSVKEIDITFVSPLKLQGAFTVAAALQAKQLAVQRFKQYYSVGDLVDLAMTFNVDAAGLDKILETMIEASIFDNLNIKPGSISLS